MAKPVINAQIGIQETQQYAPYALQLFATNSPDSITTFNVPAGMTVTLITGGAIHVAGPTTDIPGTYQVTIIATAGGVASDPFTFPLGVYAGTPVLDSLVPKFKWDMATGLVTLLSGGGFFAKSGTTFMAYLFLVDGSIPVTPTIADDGVVFAFRKDMPENNIVVTTTSKQLGSGAAIYYAVYGTFISSDVDAALTDVLTDTTDQFTAVGEVQITIPNPRYGDGLGPANLVVKSRNFDAPFALGLF